MGCRSQQSSGYGALSACSRIGWRPSNSPPDNYATHKTQLIRNWLAKRPRWHVHLTPTSSSWLNQVERFFALITERKIRRGIYRSVAALRAEITSFIEHHNADPKPFRWTKSADDILSSIERFCAHNSPAKV